MVTGTQVRIREVFEMFKDIFSWKSSMQSPALVKVTLSARVGRVRKEKEKVKLIQDRLSKITGQKPVERKAKKSIASFKLREGEVVGYLVTLRGKYMYSFLDRLIHVALPRMRDFRGIPLDSVDKEGNLTIGIPDHTIFPETSEENLQDAFGFSITMVTSAKTREESIALLKHIGVPFRSGEK